MQPVAKSLLGRRIDSAFRLNPFVTGGASLPNSAGIQDVNHRRAARPRAPRPWHAALAVLFAAAAVANPSFGETPSGAVALQAANVTRVKQLYDDGMAAVKQEDWQKAYDAFNAAWKIKRHYQIGAQLGRAELKLGKYRDAAEHLSFLLREARDLSADDRALVRRMLNEATAKIGTLRILVNREGAQIFINSAAAGTSPIDRELYVAPGTITVEARLGREGTRKVTVELEPGATRQVGLRFGGRTTPAESTPAPALLPRAAQTHGAAPKFNEVLIGTGIGISAAAMGAGALATALSFSKADRRSEACGNADDDDYPKCAPSTWLDLESSRTTLADVALASFVGGGITLGTTVIYAVFGPGWLQSLNLNVGMHFKHTGSFAAVNGTW